MTDHQHLRELAQNATEGPWEARPLQHSEFPGKRVLGPRKPGDTAGGPVTLMQPIFWDERSAANAEFIAAANPTVILDLLTELEDTRAAYALTRHQLDAHRAGQGTYEGNTR